MGLSALAIASLAVSAAGAAASYENQKHAQDERNDQLQAMRNSLNAINKKNQDAMNQTIQSIAEQNPQADEAAANKQYLGAIMAAQHAAKGDITPVGADQDTKDYAAQAAQQLDQYGTKAASTAASIFGPQALRRQQGYQISDLGNTTNYFQQLANLIRENATNNINSIEPNPYLALLSQGAQAYGSGALGNYYKQKSQKALGGLYGTG